MQLAGYIILDSILSEKFNLHWKYQQNCWLFCCFRDTCWKYRCLVGSIVIKLSSSDEMGAEFISRSDQSLFFQSSLKMILFQLKVQQVDLLSHSCFMLPQDPQVDPKLRLLSVHSFTCSPYMHTVWDSSGFCVVFFFLAPPKNMMIGWLTTVNCS